MRYLRIVKYRGKNLQLEKRKIMEKKIYEKPAMQVEAFIANDYCVNCSTDPDHNYLIYSFACDGGKGEATHMIYGDDEYYIHDGNGNYHTINGTYYGPRADSQGYIHYYHPCGKTHEVKVPIGTPITDLKDILVGNYYLDDRHTYSRESIGPVTIWTEGGTTVHATTITNPKEWHLAKS